MDEATEVKSSLGSKDYKRPDNHSSNNITIDSLGVEFRDAEERDCEELCQFGARMFTVTFGHLYPPEDLKNYLEYDYTVEKYRNWVKSANVRLLLAVETKQTGPEIVGYIVCGPCEFHTETVTKNCMEIYRCYVDPTQIGKGTAGRLMKISILWMLENFKKNHSCNNDATDGATLNSSNSNSAGSSVWVGVYSENYRAQNFYARFGFVTVDSHEFHIGRCIDTDYICQLQDMEKFNQEIAKY